jgi:hypothetical protein
MESFSQRMMIMAENTNRNLLIAAGIIIAILLALLVLEIRRDGSDLMYYWQGQGSGYGGRGPGMMGDWDSSGYDRYVSEAMGPGMMDGFGRRYYSGMMGAGSGGMGMMALYFPDEVPISEDEARSLLSTFAAEFGDEVELKDFMAFSNNYYAQVADSRTNEGLAEILADRYSGAVYPEPGPNMAWNTRFGLWKAGSESSRYDLEGARDLAETFLSGYLPGSEVVGSSSFPGYYTFDFGRGEVEGMLSVNAETGDVWVHTWHGFYLGGHEVMEGS